jgi:NAD-dependent deacetylase
MTERKANFCRAAQIIARSSCAVAFTGAGISTASGIPDFRSRDSGLWNDVDPMAVSSIYRFRQDPAIFYDWVKPLARQIMEAKPNSAHYALANLEAHGYLKAIITQNIDMLHTQAGSLTVYELHGHLREMTCTHCFSVYPGEPILRQFLEDGLVPHCGKCGGVLKPNVILYGEQLPIQALQASQKIIRRCDVMVIVGSSLEVFPASELPNLAIKAGAKLITINLEPTPADDLADVVIHANAADALPKIMQCLETM